MKILSRRAITKVQASIIIAVVVVVLIAGGYYYTTSVPVAPSTTSAATTSETMSETTSAQPSIGTYAYTTTDIIVFWDPSETYSNEVVVFNNVYEQLVRYDPFQDKYIPLLATSWTVSTDGLRYTFELRQGVKFHTGNEFNATAVKYSIERNMKGWDGQGPKGASYIWSPVKEINILGRYTVEFVLSYPAALLNIAAAAYCAHIYDPYVTEQKGHDWFLQGNEAGTGPYMIEKYEKELDRITLTKFPDYWGGWAGKHFDKVVIKSVPEWATARLQLEAGEVDIIDRLPFEDIAAMQSEPGIAIVKTPAYQVMYGFFNTKKPPLDNKLVRQALSYAVPYSDIVQYVMHGYARQSKGTVPYGLWGHSEDIFQYSYNLTKAKQLLAQAGHPNGGFSLVYTYNAGDEYERRSGELYKSELAKLGITVDLRGMPWEQQWAMATAENPADRQDIFVMYWWPDYPDPYTFLGPMFHSEQTIVFNFGYYSNPEYDKLIDDAASMAGTNRDQALAMITQAQQKLVQDAPAIFFFDQEYTRAKRTNLMGYVDNPVYAHVVFWYDCYREG
jgi:peptide/nickel transport system substrate-binding protein